MHLDQILARANPTLNREAGNMSLIVEWLANNICFPADSITNEMIITIITDQGHSSVGNSLVAMSEGERFEAVQ